MPQQIRTIARGDVDPAVTSLVRFLRTYGYLLPERGLPEGLPRESTFDGAIEEAVVRYQRLHSLLETGVVDEETMRWFLLERCVGSATRDGERVRACDLPSDVAGVVELALDEADPAADIRLELTCEECRTAWTESLDPVVFAWSAVESSARRLAIDVHLLAHAYGWSEQEILALSPFRRHLYLSAVGP